MCDKGGGGPKAPKICVTSFVDGSLGELYGGEAAVSSAHSQKIGQLADFLDKIHVIDPQKRPSLNWCLTHPFIAERMVANPPTAAT